MPAAINRSGVASSSASPSTPWLVYLSLFGLLGQAVFQQTIISSMREEIYEMSNKQTRDSQAIAKLAGILEDERQERLGTLTGLATNHLRKDPEYVFDPSPSGHVDEMETDSVRKTDAQLDYLKAKSPPNKPSVRLSDAEEAQAKKKRKIYGGVGDKLHLGGFTERDEMGISHNLWNWMMGPLAIKSVVDVGCGKGVSTDYFRKKGAHVLCVEGSHDAVTQSLLPAEVIVEHDFSRGPWWPSDTYDALWSVEFLEHVGRHHMPNYLPIFHKAALIFVTSSAWGGWHHVEVHEEWWWRNRLIAAGFVYSEDLTALARQQAVNAARTEREAQHLKFRLLVFLNPRIAALPQHQHLFGGHGCFGTVIDNRDGGIPCANEHDLLPADYQSLLNCSRQANMEGFSKLTKEEKGARWQQAVWDCNGDGVADGEGENV